MHIFEETPNIMKKTILILLLLPILSYSQGCLPDGINFFTQSEIDEFPANYPGCDSIMGIVNIIGDDITNLDSLQQLVYCEHRLHIQQCPNLRSIEGLKNLKSLGNSLILEYCIGLESLKGLDQLETVGNDVLLWDNYAIHDLKGLGNLKNVGNNFVVHWMDGLKSLDGIDQLSEISGSLVVWKNDSLQSLYALSGIDTVRTGIFIQSNPRIKNLYGLDNIHLMGGMIYIMHNDSLNNLMSIEDYQAEVIDSINISYNPMLSECNIELLCDVLEINPEVLNIHDNKTGCNSTIEIEENCNETGCFPEGLVLTQQSEIDNFPINYPNCSVIEGDLKIDGDSIINLLGLSQLRKVNGNLRLNNCYHLKSLEGLEGLYEIGGDFYFWHNESLKDFNGLTGLHKVGGQIDIYSNDSLENLNAFSNLSEVNTLEIGSSWSLKNISGLGNLKKVKGNFVFTFNHGISDFESLSNLQDIEGKLSIHTCASLKNINGFENIKQLRGGLQISNCDSLIDLSGLRNLKSVDVSCYFVNLESLRSFHGLDSLTEVGNWGVSNLSSIKNFDGLNSDLVIHGNVGINDNDSLVSFEGLENTEHLYGSLELKYNPKLQTLEHLHHLKSISDGIYIRGNESIKDFSGLENVFDFKGQIGIVDNPKLKTLKGLDNIETDSISRFEITENPNLYMCAVPSICDFVDHIPDSIYVNISDNVYGCNNKVEIQESCVIQSNAVYGFPLFNQQPHWSVVEKQMDHIGAFETQFFEYSKDTVICNRYYSRVELENSIIYVRQDSLKYYYRIGQQCESREYLLYDFNLKMGDLIYLGWGQHEFVQRDTARFAVSDICELEQFGKTRKMITLADFDGSIAYNGSLHWVEGIGCLEHPFYSLVEMEDEYKKDYEVLCFDSTAVQFYQNPNYNTCDTSYTAIDEINESGFQVYPNPFKDQFEIRLNGEKIENIQMYSITGQELPLQWTQNTQTAQIRILEEGVYGVCLLRIKTEKLIKNYKVLRIRDFTD
jgi:hypothetical protein